LSFSAANGVRMGAGRLPITSSASTTSATPPTATMPVVASSPVAPEFTAARVRSIATTPNGITGESSTSPCRRVPERSAA
jgi:hypothetical protein